jgi:isoleucyl-tRNA synthetase
VDDDAVDASGQPRGRVHPDFAYVAVEVGGEALIVAEGLLRGRRREAVVGIAAVIARIPGTRDRSRRCGRASLLAGSPASSSSGTHVTLDAGPVRAHGPGHGADDFRVGQAYGLPPFNPVADDGTFVREKVTRDWLAGVHVFKANR